jgi:lanthanide-dependent methanol dehydrogenase
MIALAVGCSQKPGAQQTAAASRPFTPPAQPYKFDAEDGQWMMPAKNYSSTRFSGLSEITTATART